jgi:hypothetical protein
MDLSMLLAVAAMVAAAISAWQGGDARLLALALALLAAAVAVSLHT